VSAASVAAPGGAIDATFQQKGRRVTITLRKSVTVNQKEMLSCLLQWK
jgi:hypothetical protein